MERTMSLFEKSFNEGVQNIQPYRFERLVSNLDEFVEFDTSNGDDSDDENLLGNTNC